MVKNKLGMRSRFLANWAKTIPFKHPARRAHHYRPYHQLRLRDNPEVTNSFYPRRHFFGRPSTSVPS
jgi:hypothetical protein